MGNKLATQNAYTQLDYYLHDLPGTIVSEQSLTSGALLKCIKCIHDEGPVIVKVYIKRSSDIDLKEYVQKLIGLRDTLGLRSCLNSAPCKKFIVTEKAGYMLRQYFAYNLHDRIGSRPFLTLVEKSWITYQLLQALEQIRFYGHTHGDIKSENVMLTSWNWVYLVDFACYKPTYLPEDGPSDFSFFFDNSGRRTCYLAPERFISGKETMQGEVTHAMDIFSLGCVIAEMFLGGAPSTIFTLAQLLSYRKGQYDPSTVIDRIDCKPARELIKKMISMDPTERETSSYYLTTWSEMGFPSYFQQYHTYISSVMLKEPDHQVLALENDFPRLLSITKKNGEVEGGQGEGIPCDVQEILSPLSPSLIVPPDVHIPSDLPPQFIEEYISYASSLSRDGSSLLCDTDNFLMNMESQQRQELTSSGKNSIHHAPKSKDRNTSQEEIGEPLWTPSVLPLDSRAPSMPPAPLEGMQLLLSLLCTSLKHIIAPANKVKALHLFIQFSEHLTDYSRLQRIVPYIVSILHDPSPIVRSHGIIALTRVLDTVHTLPPSDVHIFPEYIMPAVEHFSSDPETIVRESYARHLPKLAEIARRFLEISQILLLQQSETFGMRENLKEPFTNYDTSLKEIHDLFTSVISTMFWKDCPTCVKRALLEDITRLAVFYGKKNTADILLPMIVTFLNENDWELRSCFFRNIVGLCEYGGGHSLESFIYPCIIQALSDKEEFVITAAINALASMAEKNLLRKQTLYDIARKTSPLFLHPNIWIRNSVISGLSTIASRLDIVDRFTFLADFIRPFLYGDVVDMTVDNLLATLLPPLSRGLFERSIIACNDTLQHWVANSTKDQQNRAKSIVYKPSHPYDSQDPFIVNFKENLHAAGFTEEEQSSVLLMSSYIKEMARQVVATESRADFSITASEHIGIAAHSVTLPDIGDMRTVAERVNEEEGWLYIIQSLPQDPITGFSEGEETEKEESREVGVGTRVTSTRVTNTRLEPQKLNAAALEHTLLRTPPSLPDFGSCRKQETLSGLTKKLEPIRAWKPSGTLVAHLTQHKKAVNQLAVSADSQFFASCSNDGTVRIWDCQRLEKKVTNRSRLLFDQQSQGGKLLCMKILEHSHSIACGSEFGKVSIFRVDSDTRKDVIDYKQCSMIDRSYQASGSITAIEHFNQSMESLLVCSTSAGKVEGFDLRMDTTAFHYDNLSRAGPISSMITSPSGHWLVTGTIRGCYTCWDMRFGIPVCKWWQPGEHNQIYRLAKSTGTTFFSSVGNGQVNLWDIQDQGLKNIWDVMDDEKPRQYPRQGEPPTPTIYAERLKKLPLQTKMHRALTVAPGGGHFFITGSADKKMRYWSLANGSHSYVISGLGPSDPQPKYICEKTESLEICQELPVVNQFSSFSTPPRITTPSVNHHDNILDVVFAEQPLNMIISSSRDGVIKVWK